MISWRIGAHGCHEAVAGETPDDLAEPLRMALGARPRRVNRYTRLALLGAHRCAGQLSEPLPARTPLYLASEQGDTAETVSLMDGILRDGQPPRPMSFVNVSSNMAGFHVAASLGLTGRNMTVARQRGSFGAMLELASLDPGSGEAMLLGTVSECVWPLADHRQRCELDADALLAEGSYWLVASAATHAHGPALEYATTRDAGAARDWLAAGDCWACDPHLPDQSRGWLASPLDPAHAWSAPLAHRGHPDAVAHLVFSALADPDTPRLRVVAGDAGWGYQLIGVAP